MKKVIVLPALLLALSLIACTPASREINLNVSSIETILDKDGSGRNIIKLLVPEKTDCMSKRLQSLLVSRLNKLEEEVDELVLDTPYEDAETESRGVILIYEFVSFEHIPKQIHHLLTALGEPMIINNQIPPAVAEVEKEAVEVIATGTPTLISTVGPTPTPKPTPTSTPTPIVSYNPNELSLVVEPSETYIGKEWKMAARINPMLFVSPDPECRVPVITYKLTMPSNITDPDTKAVLFPDYSLKYVNVDHKTGSNSIQWTMQPLSVYEILYQEAVRSVRPNSELEAKEGRVQLERTIRSFDELLELLELETKKGRAQLVKMFNNSFGFQEIDAAQLQEIADSIDSKIDRELERLREIDEDQAKKFVKLAEEKDQTELFRFLLFNGPTYTLTATSRTTMLQFLIDVVAPIVALIGGLVGIIVGILKAGSFVKQIFTSGKKN